MRNNGIDGLKTICAFLIVCIHIPFEFFGGGVLHCIIKNCCSPFFDDFRLLLQGCECPQANKKDSYIAC